jgi:hypothetical protein
MKVRADAGKEAILFIRGGGSLDESCDAVDEKRFGIARVKHTVSGDFVGIKVRYEHLWVALQDFVLQLVRLPFLNKQVGDRFANKRNLFDAKGDAEFLEEVADSAVSLLLLVR